MNEDLVKINRLCKGKYLILIKEEDLAFNGNHPNGINVGDKLRGYCNDEIKIGEPLLLYLNQDSDYVLCWTTRVKNIDSDKMLLYTKNSVYKIEIYESE